MNDEAEKKGLRMNCLPDKRHLADLHHSPTVSMLSIYILPAKAHFILYYLYEFRYRPNIKNKAGVIIYLLGNKSHKRSNNMLVSRYLPTAPACL